MMKPSRVDYLNHVSLFDFFSSLYFRHYIYIIIFTLNYLIYMKFGRVFFSQNIFSKNSVYIEKKNEHLFFTGPLVEL